MSNAIRAPIVAESLPDYREIPVSASCNPLQGNTLNLDSIGQVARGEKKYGTQMIDMTYNSNNNNYYYEAEARGTASSGCSSDINYLNAASSSTQPSPMEQGMITPTPTDTPTQKQMRSSQSQSQSQYRCWKHGCEGRTFSSSANFRRHLREQGGRGRKWMCMHCMKKFSPSSACRHHIDEGVCFKVDSDSQQQEPQIKVLY